MKKVLFAICMIFGLAMMTSSCSDDLSDGEITIPQYTTAESNGNNEGEPDTGD